MWFTVAWHNSKKIKHIIGIAICIGLASLVRVTEIISLLIPLMYSVSSFKGIIAKFHLFRKHFLQLIVFTVIIFTLISFQLIYFKIYAGKFLYNSYGGNAGEGFEFLRPFFLEVLFSFRKGWIIYTPVILFFIAGLFTNIFNKTQFKNALILFFIVDFYFVASWSCWWYSGSFGQRALIPIIACFCLPFASLTEWIINRKIKYLFFAVLLLLSFLNIFQTWQLSENILDSERMSRAYYSSIFLQTKPATEEQKKLLLVDRSEYVKDSLNKDELKKLQLCKTTWLNFENDNKEHNIIDSIANSGKRCCVVQGKTNSPEISIIYSNISTRSYLWVKAGGFYYIPKIDTSATIIFRITMNHNGYDYGLRRRFNVKTHQKGWHKLEIYWLTPEIRNPSKDLLKVYIENDSNNPLCVDDIFLMALEPKINE